MSIIKSKVTAALALLAASALALSGCGGGSSPSGEEPEGPKTVRLALTQDVETLLPMDSNVNDNIAVLDVIYDGLVRYQPETTEPYNYIASDISSPDNTVWTIKIKDGFTFHNGEPVDAESFARAWNYAAYGPNAVENNYFFERFKGYEEMQGEYEEDDEGKVTVSKEPTAKELSGVEVVDAATLKVTLNAPFVGFSTMLGYTGFFPVAKACLDDIKACAVKPIGNGPFQVEEWEQGVKLTANKWADYKGEETPNFDRVEWTEYSGSSSWPDFQAGDLDTGAPPPAEWQSANNDPELTARKVERPGAGLTYLGFPLYKGSPWNNLEFRKAISMAIDRKSIIEQVLPGQAVPADSWVVPGGVPGGEAGTCEWCTFDPEAAKAALAKAGGWPAGKTLTISLGQDDTQEQYFRAIGDQIKLNLGIPYELDPTPDFFSRRGARDFDGAFRNNWFPDYPLNENYLAPVYASGDPKGNTNFGYYNQDFEKLISEGDQSKSVEEAVAKYAEAEKVLAQDFPTVPLSFALAVTFHSDRVENVVIDPFSGATKLRLLKYVG
ncbi:ABC transporter substrate-binding protein [Microlunatus sp. GCM10028923]|uniref:peptide ABC transporter substrate-binding protein n=1 Tax=Microlunatus sp. GCM10028923 TaxID=3273400 RepID=UPI0036163C21